MSDRLKALREKRGRMVEEMREIVDLAEKEKRDLTDDEVTKHRKLGEDFDKTSDQLAAEERTIAAERSEADARAAAEEAERRSKSKPEENSVDALQMKAFNRYLSGRSPESGEGAEEYRALQAGVDTEGGYIVAPQTFVTQLIKKLDDMTFIRRKATVMPLTESASLGAPSLDADPDDAEWTTELGTGSEDDSMRFGKRELRPHPFAKRIKVSKKLLRIAALPIDQIVLQRLAYKFGVTEEKGFCIGDGNKKPLGVFTASPDGIPTSRDVASGNTTTSLQFDGLVNAKYSVKGGYWPNANWLFHRDAVKQIVKLKDGEGQYIWRMSVRDGEPDSLLGHSMMISEFAPNTFTSGNYVGLFGDFSFYWIADALDVQIQRLVELYAESNQDGFIGRKETDGAPVLAEAFARVALA